MNINEIILRHINARMGFTISICLLIFNTGYSKKVTNLLVGIS